MAGGRPGGSVEWCPELEGLRDHPYVMLLAAIVLRARWDGRDSREAKEFVEQVQANAREGLGPEGILMAMDGKNADGRQAKKRVVGIWW